MRYALQGYHNPLNAFLRLFWKMSAWTWQVANPNVMPVSASGSSQRAGAAKWVRLMTWRSSAPAASPAMETSGSSPEPAELQGGTDLAHKVTFSLRVFPREPAGRTAKNNRMSEKCRFFGVLRYANQIPWLIALVRLPTNPTRLARQCWALHHDAQSVVLASLLKHGSHSM